MSLDPQAGVFALTHDEQRRLRDLQAELTPIRQTIAKLKLAGIDVTEQEERLEKLAAMRDGLLAQFPARGLGQ